jgi:hypothetical protein
MQTTSKGQEGMIHKWLWIERTSRCVRDPDYDPNPRLTQCMEDSKFPRLVELYGS